MKVVIMTGPPYSGKGTQCEILEKELQFKHISTGERIRAEKEGGVLMAYAGEGKFVPDELMEDLMITIFNECKNEKGIILDGYPRTVPQVDTLIQLLAKMNWEINKVINIEVPKNELLERAKNRALTSDRKDDQDVNKHLKRIDDFVMKTLPAIEYFKTKVIVKNINGEGTIKEVTESVAQEIKSL